MLSEHGLGIARGRVIPGFGLSNLVVPLGRSFLEITYPNGEDPNPALPPVAAVQQKALGRASEPLVPVAWLVGFENAATLHRLANRNDLAVSEVPAEGAGYPGYTLAGFGPNLVRPWLPTLIHWPVPHEEKPGALTAPHTRRPTGILHLDIAGREEDIERWCGELPEGVRLVNGDAGPLRVSVGFHDGPPITLGIL
ncbi:VOC family protein [Nonomuraea turkmeniaca]|uniref:VOC family protein n=1 Tax=Nonomuraea turkmeniaca TaxID=103838 RepID=A0A5S4F2R2_9ACTN|nr:VOC family protein [Nonomuraea turkmeniaca]TMR10285.1 VOC family protein [Nonomuraea turkmeniaca]